MAMDALAKEDVVMIGAFAVLALAVGIGLSYQKSEVAEKLLAEGGARMNTPVTAVDIDGGTRLHFNNEAYGLRLNFVGQFQIGMPMHVIKAEQGSYKVCDAIEREVVGRTGGKSQWLEAVQRKACYVGSPFGDADRFDAWLRTGLLEMHHASAGS